MCLRNMPLVVACSVSVWKDPIHIPYVWYTYERVKYLLDPTV